VPDTTWRGQAVTAGTPRAEGDVQAAILGICHPTIKGREAEHFPYWKDAPFVGPQAVVYGGLHPDPGGQGGLIP